MVSQYIYYIIGGYFLLAGFLGVGMYLIWITLRFRIKFYDLEALYGKTGARIICIILGLLIIAIGYIYNSVS
ncbi:MAG: hypothetical protein K9L74_00170 [Candidatus Izimaplasma sp.]|nr:hypothetical protein [Candidatus Izimaplasma bacterium]